MSALPEEIPVMTLSDAVFFPRTVIPLRIFEPRYREMLADALAHERIFAIASIDHTENLFNTADEPPRRIATAGVIRACQKNPDDSANLLLQGIARIEITGIVRETPYRMVRVRTLEDQTDATPDSLARLKRQLLRAFDVRARLVPNIPGDIARSIREIEDPAHLCDLLVYSFVRDAGFKQRLLETLDPAARLRLAIERFRRETDDVHLQRRLQGPLGDSDIANN